jgi:TrmH family RNA methyltransferase
MVTKSLINQIHNLKQKKFRQKTGLFVAEGEKLVQELLKANFKFTKLLTTEINSNFSALLITKKQMKKLTHFKTASDYIGIFYKPIHHFDINEEFESVLVLDGISDPGNLGTIIRTCDWYGISDIVCSKETVDCYNSKVVQSSMGSISRVKCHYIDIIPFLKTSKLQKLGATLEGKSIYDSNLNKNIIFVFGNESKGISIEVKSFLDNLITIPKNRKSLNIDSLNVAVSVAVILGERFRQII